MQVSVKANTYVYLAILTFLVPVPWMLAWIVAVAFHECCHYLAVRILGGDVYRLSIHIGGIEMQCGTLTERRRILAILCGPASGFLLVLLGRWFPRLALCSWVLSVYNLIPLLPLDGGRALEILVSSRTFYCVQKVLIILLSFSAIFACCYLKLGILPVLITVGLWVRNRNTSCKQTAFKVQ